MNILIVHFLPSWQRQILAACMPEEDSVPLAEGFKAVSKCIIIRCASWNKSFWPSNVKLYSQIFVTKFVRKVGSEPLQNYYEAARLHAHLIKC